MKLIILSPNLKTNKDEEIWVVLGGEKYTTEMVFKTCINHIFSHIYFVLYGSKNKWDACLAMWL